MLENDARLETANIAGITGEMPLPVHLTEKTAAKV